MRAVNSSRPLNIAVADDDPVMRDYFRRMLTHFGHDVVGVAADGAELVRLCHDQSPDLVITDISMPEKDGLDAVREICRENEITAIVVSAHDESQYTERSKREHVLGYLVKPIKKEDLQLALERVQSHSGGIRQGQSGNIS